MQKCSFWNGWWMCIRNLEQTNGGIRSPFWCILVNDTMGFQKTAFTEYFLSGKDILCLLFCFTMLMSNWQDGFIFITSLAVRAFLAISQTGCVYFKTWWLTSPAHRIKLCWSWYSLHSCSHSSHCHHMHTTGPRACGLSPADPPSSYLQFFPLKTLKKVTKCSVPASPEQQHPQLKVIQRASPDSHYDGYHTGTALGKAQARWLTLQSPWSMSLLVFVSPCSVVLVQMCLWWVHSLCDRPG